jgi:ABC-type phosphate transport system substrate-binding protein
MSRSMSRMLMRLTLVCGLLAVGAQQAAAQHSAVAIVVHPESTVNDLTFAQLRRVFLGEQQFWSGRDRITLLVRAPQAPEREVVLNRIYRMNESQYQQYWIAKLFRAEVASGPKIVYSSEMANELVTGIPGAITFLPASAVSSGVKVLRIDGKLPGEPGYPLY